MRHELAVTAAPTARGVGIVLSYSGAPQLPLRIAQHNALPTHHMQHLDGLVDPEVPRVFRASSFCDAFRRGRAAVWRGEPIVAAVAFAQPPVRLLEENS